jgi:hypothetical protein
MRLEENEMEYELLARYIAAAVIAYRLDIKPELAFRRYIQDSVQVAAYWLELARVADELAAAYIDGRLQSSEGLTQ